MAISKHAKGLARYPDVEHSPTVGILLPHMPRREFRKRKGRSEQFWAITLEGNRYTVQSGKAGTEGKTGTRTFPSPKAAQASYRKVVAEKFADGYTAVL